MALCGALAPIACGFPDVGYDETDLRADGGPTSIDSGRRDLAVGSGPGNGSGPSPGVVADLADASEEGRIDAEPLDPSDPPRPEGGASGGTVGDGSSTGGGSVGTTSGGGGVGDAGAAASSGSSGGAAASSGSSGSSSGAATSSGSSSGVAASSGSSGSSGGAGSGGSSGSGGAVCNCSAAQLYPANVSCGGVVVTALNLGLLCSQTAGFVGNDPGCGNPGTFITCTADLSILACSATMSTVVQQCH